MKDILSQYSWLNVKKSLRYSKCYLKKVNSPNHWSTWQTSCVMKLEIHPFPFSMQRLKIGSPYWRHSCLDFSKFIYCKNTNLDSIRYTDTGDGIEHIQPPQHNPKRITKTSTNHNLDSFQIINTSMRHATVILLAQHTHTKSVNVSLTFEHPIRIFIRHMDGILYRCLKFSPSIIIKKWDVNKMCDRKTMTHSFAVLFGHSWGVICLFV